MEFHKALAVPGSVFFTLYTTPLSAILSSFDINHYLYADDTQIYMSLYPFTTLRNLLGSCNIV